MVGCAWSMIIIGVKLYYVYIYILGWYSLWIGISIDQPVFKGTTDYRGLWTMLKSMTDFWRILDKKAWKFLVPGNWLWHLMNDFRIQHICWNIWKVIALAQFLFCNCGFCIEIYSVFILYVLLGMMCVWCALFWFLLLTLHICSMPACLLACLFNHVERTVGVIGFLWASVTSVSNLKNIYPLVN